MTRRLLLTLPSAFAAPAQVAVTPRPAQQSPARPALVLLIVIDQFRYDYLTRFRASYTGGLARLWRQGAVFTNAFYEHFPTVTAVGHATILSGAYPSTSGIVGNEWYDRILKKQVTSVEDPAHKMVGAEGAGASPRNLMVSTIGDELKMSGRGSPKVFGISLKDRSAIMPAGRMGDGAFWFDDRTGNFVSSTFYSKELPPWVAEYNRSRAADKFLGAEWKPVDDPNGKPFVKMASRAEKAYFTAMERTPYGNELLASLAERAIVSEKLGQRPGSTDLLSVSFSSNDYVGHDNGPDSLQVRDMSVRTDRLLGRFLEFVDKQAGLNNVLVIVTADHGVAPLPELMQERRMPGGRVRPASITAAVQARLVQQFGPGNWILGKSGPAPYLNHDLRPDLAALRLQAAEAVREMPHILRVYTSDQLAGGQVPNDPMDQRILNGYYPPRASDLFLVPEPYWIFSDDKTSHGTPFIYDAHVPVILMGPGIRPGRYPRRIAVNDIAPTVATMLEVETPGGSVGRVLDEALAPLP